MEVAREKVGSPVQLMAAEDPTKVRTVICSREVLTERYMLGIYLNIKMKGKLETEKEHVHFYSGICFFSDSSSNGIHFLALLPARAGEQTL